MASQRAQLRGECPTHTQTGNQLARHLTLNSAFASALMAGKHWFEDEFVFNSTDVTMSCWTASLPINRKEQYCIGKCVTFIFNNLFYNRHI